MHFPFAGHSRPLRVTCFYPENCYFICFLFYRTTREVTEPLDLVVYIKYSVSCKPK